MLVIKTKRPGLYGDGGGLYLQVSEKGAKSWIFRYQLHGRSRAMGLGPIMDVPLARARELATQAREQRRQGIDPIQERERSQAEQRLLAARMKTFRVAAEEYIDDHSHGWRNPKHRAQWGSTLERYAYPIIGNLPVQDIDTELVMRVLRPIWSTKPETASRVRGRIEAVLDAEAAVGRRSGDNPARWRGHLSKLLAPKRRVRNVRHHPALPYDEIGDFMTKLRAQAGTAAEALELLILTVSRTGEITGADMHEFDLKAAAWIVPEDRIKGGKEHRVPLSQAALTIVRRRIGERSEGYLFPGGKLKRPLSENALLALLDRMGYGHITVHGFRSTFRDWVAERTNYPNEVAEMALAHVVGNETEAAYRRGDLFEKRRALMAEWARFCSLPPTGAEVVPMRA